MSQAAHAGSARVLEDTKLGLAFLTSVAAWAGVEAPVARGLLAVASAVVGEDFLRTGRTLEAFGLARLNGPQMTELLQEGL